MQTDTLLLSAYFATIMAELQTIQNKPMWAGLFAFLGIVAFTLHFYENFKK